MNDDENLNEFIDQPKRTTRVRNPPSWLKDYDTSLSVAMSIESVLDGIPKSYKEAVSGENKENWIQAMKGEINAHEENETWILADKPENRKVISSGWVFTIKK